jgi:cell division protease FtsH
MPKTDPLHKVTIIPRGRALGVTMSLPERDQLSQSEIQLKSRLAIMYGGRIAEELVFGKDNITTGAGNDIQQATNMARRMVTEFGFSEELGPLRYADNEEEVFLGHSVARQKHMSEATAAIIDNEVRRLIDEAEAQARRVISEHRDGLETIAKGLLEFESLSGEEVEALLRGEAIVRKDDDNMATPPDGGRKASVPTSGAVKKDGKKDEGGPGLGAKPQPEG